MAHKKLIRKFARYFQLLIFVSYLSHGFIPHHHHDDKLGSIYEIEFNHSNHVCACHGVSLDSGTEMHSECLLCDQLNKEFHNHGYFFKEPVLALNIEFKDVFTIFTDEEGTEAYPIIDDFPILADATILYHGLRAPPVS